MTTISNPIQKVREYELHRNHWPIAFLKCAGQILQGPLPGDESYPCLSTKGVNWEKLPKIQLLFVLDPASGNSVFFQ